MPSSTAHSRLSLNKSNKPIAAAPVMKYGKLTKNNGQSVRRMSDGSVKSYNFDNDDDNILDSPSN